MGRIVGTVLQKMREQFDYLESLKRHRPRCLGGVNSRTSLMRPLPESTASGPCFEDMLALTENRQAKNEQQSIKLDSLAQRSVRLFRHDLLGRRRNLEVDCQSDLSVLADPCRMIHVLINLLRNAAQATVANDTITLRTWREGEWGVIEVADTGHGMTRETLERIFTPFFTTKGREGMGLGLRLAKATVESHRGNIICTSNPGQGTRFQIRLPKTRNSRNHQ